MKTALRLTALLLLVVLAGCGGNASTEGADAGGTDAMEVPEPAPASLADRDGATSDQAAEASEAKAVDRQEVSEAALIHRAHVSLSSDEVGKARLAAQSVADKYDGEVTESETSSDDDGKTSYARMVLRVPAESFGKAMADLEEIGTLRESSTDTDDASTQVADVGARVKVQRTSIDRIRTLLSAAKDIGDIVRIESELSRREADLDSLLAQQAHLADQTSRSTITVSISRTDEERDDEPAGGFLGGLERGWDGLVAFTSGALLVLGVLVPWLPLIGLTVALLWWGGKRLRPRRQAA